MSIYPTNQFSRSDLSPRRLGLRLLPTVESSLYTVPPDRHAVIDRIFVANNNNNAATINIHHVPAGSTSSTANALIHGYSVAGKSYLSVEGPIYLSPNDTITASANTADALCLNLYGAETVR